MFVNAVYLVYTVKIHVHVHVYHVNGVGMSLKYRSLVYVDIVTVMRCVFLVYMYSV